MVFSWLNRAQVIRLPYLSISQRQFLQVHPPHIACLQDVGQRKPLVCSVPHCGHLTGLGLIPILPCLGQRFTTARVIEGVIIRATAAPTTEPMTTALFIFDFLRKPGVNPTLR